MNRNIVSVQLSFQDQIKQTQINLHTTTFNCLKRIVKASFSYQPLPNEFGFRVLSVDQETYKKLLIRDDLSLKQFFQSYPFQMVALEIVKIDLNQDESLDKNFVNLSPQRASRIGLHDTQKSIKMQDSSSSSSSEFYKSLQDQISKQQQQTQEYQIGGQLVQNFYVGQSLSSSMNTISSGVLTEYHSLSKDSQDQSLITQAQIQKKQSNYSSEQDESESEKEEEVYYKNITKNLSQISKEMLIHWESQFKSYLKIDDDKSYLNFSNTSCIKCLKVFNNQSDIKYYCQQCNILLCEKCEEIFDHSHPFLKVKREYDYLIQKYSKNVNLENPIEMFYNKDSVLNQSKKKEKKVKKEFNMKYKDSQENNLQHQFSQNETLIKSFKIKNNGSKPWPKGTQLFKLTENNTKIPTEIIFQNEIIPNEVKPILIKYTIPENQKDDQFLIFRLGYKKFSGKIQKFGKRIFIQYKVISNKNEESKKESEQDENLKEAERIQDQDNQKQKEYIEYQMKQDEYLAQVLSDPEINHQQELKYVYLKELGLIDFKRNKYILNLCKGEQKLAANILLKEQKNQKIDQ